MRSGTHMPLDGDGRGLLTEVVRAQLLASDP